MITKQCIASNQTFTITDDDVQFYAKMGVPLPTLCPAERARRRTAYRNDRHLYKRQCNGTGKPMISCFSSEAPFPVYSHDYWWSDNWDAESFGREYDFNRPFFEQFHDLRTAVPLLGVAVTHSENCDYNMFCVESKNAYLCQRVANSEDVMYSHLPIRSRDCVDCYHLYDSELCYEVIDGENCYNVSFSQNVAHCRDAKFLFNCRNCQHCFFCANLRNAEYYFCNQKYTPAEYQKKMAEFTNLSHPQKQKLWTDFVRLKSEQTVPALWSQQTENVSGNYIYESKNVLHSYDVKGGQDIKYSWGASFCHDLWDTSYMFHNNNCYEVCSGIYGGYLRFCFGCYNDSLHLDYCFNCMSCESCFGCCGLKKRKNCILNRAYTNHEYENLTKKIINHMTETGEWGEFFPIKYSPFAYNETVAHEYLPLTKAEASKRGYNWRDDQASTKYIGQTHTIPDRITDVSNDICQQILTCEATGRNYKIQKSEFAFYQQLGLPIPRLHHDERHRRRVSLRNPRRLWNRQCAQCSVDIKTTFSPDRPEKVLCEKCYLKVVN